MAVIYKKKQITLKLWLNEKSVGLTKLGKTQRMIGLLCTILKNDEFKLG